MAVDHEPSPDGTVQLSGGKYVPPRAHEGGAPLYKWHRCDELRRMDREYRARRKARSRAMFAMLLALALALASCRAAPPPPIDWPKVVHGAAELGGLAQRQGQTIVVCLVGDAPNAVLINAPSSADAPSAADKPSGTVQDGAP